MKHPTNFTKIEQWKISFDFSNWQQKEVFMIQFIFHRKCPRLQNYNEKCLKILPAELINLIFEIMYSPFDDKKFRDTIFNDNQSYRSDLVKNIERECQLSI